MHLLALLSAERHRAESFRVRNRLNPECSRAAKLSPRGELNHDARRCAASAQVELQRLELGRSRTAAAASDGAAHGPELRASSDSEGAQERVAASGVDVTPPRPRAFHLPASETASSVRGRFRADFSAAANVPLSELRLERQRWTPATGGAALFSDSASRPLSTHDCTPPRERFSAGHSAVAQQPLASQRLSPSPSPVRRPDDETAFSASAVFSPASSPEAPARGQRGGGYSAGAAHAIWSSAGHAAAPPVGCSAAAAQHAVRSPGPLPSPRHVPEANGLSPAAASGASPAHHAQRTAAPAPHRPSPEAFSGSAFSPLGSVPAQQPADDADPGSPHVFLGVGAAAAPTFAATATALFRTPAAASATRTPALAASRAAPPFASGHSESPFEGHNGYGMRPLS